MVRNVLTLLPKRALMPLELIEAAASDARVQKKALGFEPMV